MTENEDILNKYTISLFFKEMNSLNIKIRFISFNEMTTLTKNRILILSIHNCLDKGNNIKTLNIVSLPIVFLREAFDFHVIPEKFRWKDHVSDLRFSSNT